MLISARLSYRLFPWIGVSAGAGYGRSVKVTDRSYEGFSPEAGAVFTLKHAKLLLGVSLVEMHCLQFEMGGVGWHF